MSIDWPALFLGVTLGLVLQLAARRTFPYLGRVAARRGWHVPNRIIPPPKVGRWQVVAVSTYPAGGERRVGRYRMRVAARLVAWALARRFPPTSRYEVRRLA